MNFDLYGWHFDQDDVYTPKYEFICTPELYIFNVDIPGLVYNKEDTKGLLKIRFNLNNTKK